MLVCVKDLGWSNITIIELQNWKKCDACINKTFYIIQLTYKESPVCWGLGRMLESQS